MLVADVALLVLHECCFSGLEFASPVSRGHSEAGHKEGWERVVEWWRKWGDNHGRWGRRGGMGGVEEKDRGILVQNILSLSSLT